jgi:hypothetical protein
MVEKPLSKALGTEIVAFRLTLAKRIVGAVFASGRHLIPIGCLARLADIRRKRKT